MMKRMKKKTALFVLCMLMAFCLCFVESSADNRHQDTSGNKTEDSRSTPEKKSNRMYPGQEQDTGTGNEKDRPAPDDNIRYEEKTEEKAPQEATTHTESEGKKKGEKKGSHAVIIVIAAVALLLLIAIITVLLLIRRKKSTEYDHYAAGREKNKTCQYEVRILNTSASGWETCKAMEYFRNLYDLMGNPDAPEAFKNIAVRVVHGGKDLEIRSDYFNIQYRLTPDNRILRLETPDSHVFEIIWVGRRRDH